MTSWLTVCCLFLSKYLAVGHSNLILLFYRIFNGITAEGTDVHWSILNLPPTQCDSPSLHLIFCSKKHLIWAITAAIHFYKCTLILPAILKPVGLSAVISLHLIGQWGCHHGWGSTEQVVSWASVPGAMPVCVLSWAHRDNRLQARVDSSYMSHAHISRNITLAVCVRLHTAPEIPFYGQGLCVCTGINTCTVCEKSLSVLCGHTSLTAWVCFALGFACAFVCVWVSSCMYHHLHPVIYSCHYGRCRPGVNRLLWDHQIGAAAAVPVGTHITVRINRDEALSTQLLSTHHSCCLCRPTFHVLSCHWSESEY